MQAVREGVGLLDITGFSRFEVTGPNADRWLDRMMASKLPGPGRARLAPMLGHDGKLKGDLTDVQLGPGWQSHLVDHGQLLSARLAHALVPRPHGPQWRRHGPRPWRQMSGFSLSGPKSREGDRKLTDG
jgi:dimethylglycine dehydrogenase